MVMVQMTCIKSFIFLKMYVSVLCEVIYICMQSVKQVDTVLAKLKVLYTHLPTISSKMS